MGIKIGEIRKGGWFPEPAAPDKLMKKKTLREQKRLLQREQSLEQSELPTSERKE